MERGYVKLWRKSLDTAIFKNPSLWMFWCWCLMKATHKPREQIIGYQAVDLQQGQFVFGRDKASKETGLSVQTIRTCIETLKKLENLTIKSTNKFSVITIINWDIYQPEQSQSNQQTNQQVTNKQPASNHKQECKTQKNKSYTDEFLKFWNSYPLKIGKAKAWEAWAKQNGNRPPLDDVLSAIQNQTQWRKSAGPKDFRPEWKHPSTWLNQACWNDEVDAKPPEPKKEYVWTTND